MVYSNLIIASFIKQKLACFANCERFIGMPVRKKHGQSKMLSYNFAMNSWPHRSDPLYRYLGTKPTVDLVYPSLNFVPGADTGCYRVKYVWQMSKTHIHPSNSTVPNKGKYSSNIISHLQTQYNCFTLHDCKLYCSAVFLIDFVSWKPKHSVGNPTVSTRKKQDIRHWTFKWWTETHQCWTGNHTLCSYNNSALPDNNRQSNVLLVIWC